MASFIGYPDVKVILRKKQFQWILPAQQQFDIQISDFVTSLNSMAARTNDNINLDPTLGVATISPLYANRNNFIENIAGSANRFKVDVPKGAPPETQNEINRRVWIALPTVNQNPNPSGSGDNFKKDDQEFAEPGSTTDLSGNPVDNTYPGPIWGEEFHEGTSGDPTVKRPPPVTWVHQKNSNPNTEFFLVQKYGLFSNESFWLDIKKFRSESPSNIPTEELENENGGNRFNRYNSGENLLNYFAIRIGSETPEDIQKPKGYDIVFPIGGSPFIYDHEGQGLEEEDERDFRLSNDYDYDGFIASKKTEPEWIFHNDIDSARIAVNFIRGKMVITASWASSPWFFPTDLSSQPFPKTQERYSNLFMPGSRICLMGRGIKFRFNFNPLEFNIYQNGIEKTPHGKITFGPFPTRDDFTGNNTSGWLDFDEATRDSDIQNYTIVPFDTVDFDLNGDQISKTFGFDFVKDEYPGLPGNYTSMMIPVNPNSVSSVREIIKTTMRPPTIDERRLVKPTGGPGNLSVSTSGQPIFKNLFLEVEINCKHPQYGNYVNGGSDESGFIHRRFASPVFWRFKGRMNIPELPGPEEYDISNFVKSISYNTTCPDLMTIEQNFTVDVRIPKDYEFEEPTGNDDDSFDLYRRTQIRSRDEILGLIYDGVKEVEIWLGYWGTNRYKDGALENPTINGELLFGEPESGIRRGSKRIRVFTGLTGGGQLTETYGNDLVQLKCVEKLEMIKSFYILNSPYYDGMLLERAFLHICTLSGLPKNSFKIRSNWAKKEVLPLGFSFLEPKMKFEPNTSIYEAIRKVCSLFKHVIRTDPDGAITLTDLYYNSNNIAEDQFLSAIEDIPLSHPDFVFHVDGWADRTDSPDGEVGPWTRGSSDDPDGNSDLQSPFKRCYEQFTYDKNIADRSTQLVMSYIDRISGARIIDGNLNDVDAIEDPNSKGFIGYHKVARWHQPGIGEQKNAARIRTLAASHIFQSPFNIKFTTYGRPTLQPLSIIDVVHQDPKTYLVSNGESLNEVTTNKIRYRVKSVSGNLTYEDNKWQYKMDVEAEHR